MTLDQINFKPLEQVQYALKLSLKQTYQSASVKLVIVMTLAVVAAMMINALPHFAIVIIFVIFVIVLIRWSNIKKQDWRQFAVANHWTISSTDNYAVPPVLRDMKDNYARVTSEMIKARINNLDCDLLTCVDESIRNKNPYSNYFTIARVHLTKQFPHIILDSKKNGSGIRNIPSGYENLKLEGNFNNYFSLYEAKGEEVNVLSIITPDVMQVLIDSETRQDIEIAGNYIYFIAIDDQRTPTAMRSLLQSVDKLAAEIIQRAQTLRYSPVAAK